MCGIGLYYCTFLKRLTLPENLEHYAKTAIRGCSKLEEIENRSAYSCKLFEEGVAGEWYCEGKHAEELPAGKTAKIRSITYHITYDLAGGTAAEPLPTEYKSREGIVLPDTVKKEGYSLAKWRVIPNDVLMDDLMDRIPPGEDYGNIRASAVWMYVRMSHGTTGKITGLEKGKTYYVEYVVLWDYDSDDYETEDDLPWQGKRSFAVTY